MIPTMIPTKIYISGKISGLPYEEAKAKFENAEQYVHENFNELSRVETINPMKLDVPKARQLEIAKAKEKEIWDAYMEKCMLAVIQCDAIYMLMDWGASKGARVEYAIAKEMGLTIHYQTKEHECKNQHSSAGPTGA